jgi:hypothetical protein
MSINRENFLNILATNGCLSGKRLFPDFQKGPKILKDFRIMQDREGYRIYNLFHEIRITIHSINEEGFIVRLDSLHPPFKDYLESILGKSIIYKQRYHYLEGKEYPLAQEQEYRYDEKTRNYHLYGEEPTVKEGEWNQSIKRKVNKFLKDLRQAQNFYKQFLPKDVTLERIVMYNDLKELYDLYSKHGKEALADPNIMAFNIDRLKHKIYQDLGALTITQRRVDP